MGRDYIGKYNIPTNTIVSNYSLAKNCPSWRTYLEYVGTYDSTHNKILLYANWLLNEKFYHIDLNTNECSLWKPDIPKWNDLLGWYKTIRFDKRTSLVWLCAQMIPYAGYEDNQFLCHSVSLSSGQGEVKSSIAVHLPNNTNQLGPVVNSNMGGWTEDGTRYGFYIPATIRTDSWKEQLGFVELSPTPKWSLIGSNSYDSNGYKAFLNGNKTMMVWGGICKSIFKYMLQVVDVRNGDKKQYYWDSFKVISNSTGCEGRGFPIVKSQIWIGEDRFLSMSENLVAFSLNPMSVNLLGRNFQLMMN